MKADQGQWDEAPGTQPKSVCNVPSAWRGRSASRVKTLAPQAPFPLIFAWPQVVGFSGTNDNHRLLPLQVGQRETDDPGLAGTNGKMLAVLLDNPTYFSLTPTVSHGCHCIDMAESLAARSAASLLKASRLAPPCRTTCLCGGRCWTLP